MPKLKINSKHQNHEAFYFFLSHGLHFFFHLHLYFDLSVRFFTLLTYLSFPLLSLIISSHPLFRTMLLASLPLFHSIYSSLIPSSIQHSLLSSPSMLIFVRLIHFSLYHFFFLPLHVSPSPLATSAPYSSFFSHLFIHTSLPSIHFFWTNFFQSTYNFLQIFFLLLLFQRIFTPFVLILLLSLSFIQPFLYSSLYPYILPSY